MSRQSCEFKVSQKSGKIIRNGIIALGVTIILGVVLLVLAYHVPVNPQVVQNARTLLEDQNTTADYPALKSGEQYFYSFRPGVFDGNTATFIFSNSTRMVQENYLRAAMVESYDWYWHGYVVLVRPLLYFFEYKDLEILLTFFLILLAVFLGAAIAKRKSYLYVFAFATSFLLTMPMIVGLCLQYIWIAVLSFGGVLFFLRFEDKLSKGNWFLLYFLLMGAFTSYLDFLTYPLFTWGIPVIWWLILEKKEKIGRNAVCFVILSAVAWAFGYTGMWAGKWLAGSIILHKNVFSDAFTQILQRAGAVDASIISDRLLYRSGTADTYSLRERLYSVYKNWKHYSYGLYAILLLGWTILFLYQGFVYGWKKSGKACAFGLVSLSSFVWNMVAVNHMDVHHFFTYRIYGVMILSWIAIILESVEKEKCKPDFKIQRILRFGIGVLVCIIASFVLKKVTYEETEVSNKEAGAFDVFEYEDLDMEMTFVPSFSHITRFCIALQTKSESGYYDLKVTDHGEILYEEEIPVSFYRGWNYVLYPVDWKLKAGTEYQILLKAVDVEEKITAYISNGIDYLPEMSEAVINGQIMQGESLFGVMYWSPSFSVYLRNYAWISWFGALHLVYYLGYNVKDSIKNHCEGKKHMRG